MVRGSLAVGATWRMKCTVYCFLCNKIGKLLFARIMNEPFKLGACWMDSRRVGRRESLDSASVENGGTHLVGIFYA